MKDCWCWEYDSAAVNHHFPQILTILLVTMIAFSDCLLLSWTSPYMGQLEKNKLNPLSEDDLIWLPVLPFLAQLLTAPIFPRLMNIIGRKKCLLLIPFPQMGAWLLNGWSLKPWVLYMSRLSMGVGTAGVFGVAFVYVAEISEPYVRGTWSNVIILGAWLGMLTINIIGGFCSISLAATIGICLNICQFALLLILLPESPIYLVRKNRFEEAETSLKYLRWRKDVSEELTRIKSDVDKQRHTDAMTYRDLLGIKSNRRALIICLTLRSVQWLGGLPAFQTQTFDIFKKAGGTFDKRTCSIIFLSAFAMSLCFTIFLVERVGRKPLMIVSCTGCGTALMIMSIYSLSKITSFGWIPLASMLFFILSNSCGLALIPTLLLGEMFAPNIKGLAATLYNVDTACSAMIVNWSFKKLTSAFSIGVPFFIFSIITWTGVPFCAIYMIETKGKTLQEIQETLEAT